MQGKLHLQLALVVMAAAFVACGATQTAAEKEKLADDIRNAVETQRFVFKASYAYPTGYKSIYLSPFYDVKISPDTADVYLPFYGRAYTAPMNTSEGGYRFTSTDFDYKAETQSKGNHRVVITFHDTDRSVIFQLDIWKNGKATLNVNDVNRQAISFSGNVEIP